MTTPPRSKMPAHLAPYVRQFREHGWSVQECKDAIREAVFDSIAPCADGCEVEPDGECEHGFPSILVAFGYV